MQVESAVNTLFEQQQATTSSVTPVELTWLNNNYGK